MKDLGSRIRCIEPRPSARARTRARSAAYRSFERAGHLIIVLMAEAAGGAGVAHMGFSSLPLLGFQGWDSKVNY